MAPAAQAAWRNGAGCGQLGLGAPELHFKSFTAERRHMLCVGVGWDQIHAARPGGAGMRLRQLGCGVLWGNSCVI
jgi:hypothetical protein